MQPSPLRWYKICLELSALIYIEGTCNVDNEKKKIRSRAHITYSKTGNYYTRCPIPLALAFLFASLSTRSPSLSLSYTIVFLCYLFINKPASNPNCEPQQNFITINNLGLPSSIQKKLRVISVPPFSLLRSLEGGVDLCKILYS